MSLVVTRADGLVTVQDEGRVGWAHLGVTTAGFLDGPAARLANRLVGNRPGDAVVETTLGGVGLLVERSVTLAVTGADCAVTIDGRARPHGEPLSVPAGARVEIGPARSGLRSYVAVSGGIDVPAVLGSRSTDTLGGLGPAPLAPGMRLRLGAARGAPRPLDTPVPERRSPGPLRVLPGPRVDRFDERAWTVLTTTPYVVGAASNRIGLRLTGTALRASVVGELPSEGMVSGAVQVPPDGQPVVLLADHPTTGGYPVIAVVVDDDLPRCAQLRPGDVVRFVRPSGTRSVSVRRIWAPAGQGRVVDREGADRADR